MASRMPQCVAHWVRMEKKFNVVIERDSEGWLVASVPALAGCHTQSRSYDQLFERIKEAIELCLEDDPEADSNEFLGVQQVAVNL
jgi:predicted RNase H-like HicB family nuclease